MIRVKLYKQFLDSIAALRAADVEKVIFSRNEKELQKQVKELGIDKFYFIATVPNSDTNEHNTEAISEDDNCILFILKKSSDKDYDADEMIELLDDCQAIVVYLKEKIFSIANDCNHQYHSIASRIDFGTMKTDPEYDYFGMNGYSVSFQLRTDWF